MNIMEYRAIKEQESKQQDTQKEVQPNAESQAQSPEQTTPPQTQETSTSQTEDVKTPTKIVIDDIEVTPDEIKEWRKGHLRQSDYTKKTQELARQREELKEAAMLYESLKRNPELAHQLARTTDVPPTLDPATRKVTELENKLYDMMLEREIESLQAKYEDFEVREVLEIAQSKRLNNLEDAYLLARASKQGNAKKETKEQPDIETLKAQIRADLLKEIEAERASTQTIISTNDSATRVASNEPTFTQGELAYFQKRKMSEAQIKEYVKWRDAGKKKR